MSRKFIAAIVAASVAITGISSVPAQAGNRDLERILVGATVLAIIGAAVSDNKKRQQVATRYDYDPSFDRDGRRYQQQYQHQERDHHHGQQIAPRPLPQHVRRNLLPAYCEKTVQTRRGPHRVFMAQCLNENYRYSNSLPRSCSTEVRKNNGRYGTAPAYGAACLRGLGYRTAYR